VAVPEQKFRKNGYGSGWKIGHSVPPMRTSGNCGSIVAPDHSHEIRRSCYNHGPFEVCIERWKQVCSTRSGEINRDITNQLTFQSLLTESLIYESCDCRRACP
jgi:hypothetical protein